MQIKVFKIPADEPSQAEEEVNKFLRSRRILQVDKQWSGERMCWCILVEYVEVEEKVDIQRNRRRETEALLNSLSAEQRERYERFKMIRYQISNELSLPVYMVFTNAELVSMAKMQSLDAETILKVPDVPKRRLADYGHYFIDTEDNETDRELDASDSESRES